jgi:hypothetical protein
LDLIFGEESFVAIGIFFKKIFCNDAAEDGITQIFEPFITSDSMKLWLNSRFMTESLFENLEVPGCKAYNVSNTPGKMLIVREIMIIKSPDHYLSAISLFKHDQR